LDKIHHRGVILARKGATFTSPKCLTLVDFGLKPEARGECQQALETAKTAQRAARLS
jgi:hypothetical protein